MSTNPYFDSSFTADQFDQELYDSLVEESIQVNGRDYYYLPRTLSNFNEDLNEVLTDFYPNLCSFMAANRNFCRCTDANVQWPAKPSDS